MRRFRIPGAEPPQGPREGGRLGLTRGERRKLLAMVLGLGLVGILFAVGWLKARQAEREAAPAAEELDVVERVHVPEIDAARLARLVEDDDRRGQVVLERDALDALLVDARRLSPASFEALGIEPLDAALVEAIEADADRFRGRAFLARGSVLQIETRTSGAEQRHLGLLELENGGRAWFLALQVPELGSYLRVDGLFLKVYRDELEATGEWVDGPLLVAPRAERSYPALGAVERVDPALLAQVEDDSLTFGAGAAPRVSGLPFDALWQMMAWVRDLDPGAVDWAEAPELDAPALARLLKDGSAWRGKPFRFPISRLQGVRVRRAGENPARLERTTEGWLGNATWQNVVHFKTPEAHPDLRLSDYVRARGFFLKTFAYESSQHGLRVAPVFVLEQVEAFEPEVDPALRRLALGVAIGVLLLVGWIFLRVRRDRRRSRQAAELLRARRRERRAARAHDSPSSDT